MLNLTYGVSFFIGSIIENFIWFKSLFGSIDKKVFLLYILSVMITWSRYEQSSINHR